MPKGRKTVSHVEIYQPVHRCRLQDDIRAEVNKDLLIDFLNQLLNGKYEIEDVTFLDKEDKGEDVFSKTCIFDIHCLTSKGEHIIVEMQNGSQIFFRDRALYYMSRVLSSQGRPGIGWSYGQLKAVVGVFLLDFIMRDLQMPIEPAEEQKEENDKEKKPNPKFRTDVILADSEDGKPFSDKMLMVFLQLPVFDIKNPDECKTDFERWIYVLKNMETFERMPFTAQRAVFERLAKVCEVAKMNIEQKRDYDKSLMAYWDAKAQLYYFENGARLAEEKGLADGMARGMAQGMAKGMAQGIEETTRKFVIACGAKGISVPDIASLTNLTEAEVNTILCSK